MIIFEYCFHLHFVVNQGSFSTFKTAGAVIANLSQNLTVLYSNNVIIFRLQTTCVVADFFALSTWFFTQCRWIFEIKNKLQKIALYHNLFKSFKMAC